MLHMEASPHTEGQGLETTQGHFEAVAKEVIMDIVIGKQGWTKDQEAIEDGGTKDQEAIGRHGIEGIMNNPFVTIIAWVSHATAMLKNAEVQQAIIVVLQCIISK